MPNYCKTILMGHLTRDPELRQSQGGTPIAKFGVAWNEKRKGEEKAHFLDCVAFGKTAELIDEFLSKGSAVFLEGRLSLSTWEDQEGNKRSRHEMIVDTMQFVGGKGEKKAEKTEKAGGIPF